MLSPGILCEAHGRGQAYLGNPAHIGIGADLPSPNPATDSKRRRARFRDVPPTRPTERSGPGQIPSIIASGSFVHQRALTSAALLARPCTLLTPSELSLTVGEA